VGLLRPITLFPFPTGAIRALAATARVFAVVEMSTGQLVEDVRLALEGSRPVETYGRVGGNIPTVEEVLQFVERTSLVGVRVPLEVSANGH
jgi:pyruvate/2-oxoacid:ferredoxin oxidoreductase alpha subunit